MTFNNIWIEHSKPLLNFIKTKVNDQNLAEDILQEVGVKLHHNLNRKTVIKNHKTWLFQVTRNTIADHFRKSSKQVDLTNNPLENLDTSSACVCDLSSFVIQKYLPKAYSEPLFLSDIERKPQKEIAEMLNLSLVATKSRIQRGRKKLKELIVDCIDISYNHNGQITDFQLRDNCELPAELAEEMAKINLTL